MNEIFVAFHIELKLGMSLPIFSNHPIIWLRNVVCCLLRIEYRAESLLVSEQRSNPIVGLLVFLIICCKPFHLIDYFTTF